MYLIKALNGKKQEPKYNNQNNTEHDIKRNKDADKPPLPTFLVFSTWVLKLIKHKKHVVSTTPDLSALHHIYIKLYFSAVNTWEKKQNRMFEFDLIF